MQGNKGPHQLLLFIQIIQKHRDITSQFTGAPRLPSARYLSRQFDTSRYFDQLMGATDRFQNFHRQTSQFSLTDYTIFIDRLHNFHQRISHFSSTDFTLFINIFHDFHQQISQFSSTDFTTFINRFHNFHRQISQFSSTVFTVSNNRFQNLFSHFQYEILDFPLLIQL